MIKKIFCLIFLVSFYNCSQVSVLKQSPKNYLGYQPIDPVPALKVTIFESEENPEKDIFWDSITDAAFKRKLLPLQSAQISVSKTETSGELSYLSSSVSGEKGSYQVSMDYMKYRVEDVFNEEGKYIGNGRIGVGLRIKAEVVTTKANINLGSLTAIGLAAKQNNLRGGITIDIVGIDSENVTNLIPLTSEIDQTSIQSALQALASIKSKLWEEETSITPHLIAIRQAVPNKESEIRKQVSTYIKTQSGDLLRKFWKPDGKNINEENEKTLKNWMSKHGLEIGPGSIPMFLRGAEFEVMRNLAVKELIK